MTAPTAGVLQGTDVGSVRRRDQEGKEREHCALMITPNTGGGGVSEQRCCAGPLLIIKKGQIRM